MLKFDEVLAEFSLMSYDTFKEISNDNKHAKHAK